jgi:uncharacterized protein with HEPN domain
MKKSDQTILGKIKKEALLISDIMKNLDEEAFLADEKTKRAVCMALINIGELIKHLSEETRVASNHIPWKKISALRNIAAHSYQSLYMPDIWFDASSRIPELVEQVDAVIAGWDMR